MTRQTPPELGEHVDPVSYVSDHRITRELRRSGATEEQLESVQFFKTRGRPFSEWSFIHCGPALPEEALSLVKPYCALKWLVIKEPPTSRDTEDAWLSVAVAEADLALREQAPLLEAGLKHHLHGELGRAEQKKQASAKYETVRSVFDRIAAECPNAKKSWLVKEAAKRSESSESTVYRALRESAVKGGD